MKIRNTSNFVTALVIFISVITVILCVSIVETRSAATVNAVKPTDLLFDDRMVCFSKYVWTRVRLPSAPPK